MKIVVTRRGVKVSDELRTRARQLMERVGRYSRRPESGHVLFKEEGMSRQVEFRLRTANGQAFRVVGDAADFRTALDRARDKMRRRLDAAYPRPGRVR